MSDRQQRPSAPTSSDAPTRSQPGTAGVRLPERIGRYRIVRLLGEGGMGVVYEAEQAQPRRPVALKVIRGGAYVDENRVKLFQREAQTLARLRHPGIAAIYESGCTADGQHYFAMELVRGQPLDAFLKARAGAVSSRAEAEWRLGLFRKVCDAVGYAHQRGVIHRDLKPSNIMVLRQPSESSSGPLGSSVPGIKILDFGLARITESDVAATTVVTSAGQVQGTLPYMSPEQVRGNPDEIDLRSDIYSLGVLLYELQAARQPYSLHNLGIPEAARIICDTQPTPSRALGEAGKGLDRELEQPGGHSDAACLGLPGEPVRGGGSGGGAASRRGRSWTGALLVSAASWRSSRSPRRGCSG